MKRHSIFYWNWQRTAVVVIVGLAFLQLFRANRPPTASEAPPPPPKYTNGTIVDASVAIPPRSFVSYKVETNRRTNLKGEFQTGSTKIRIEVLVFDDGNFEAWKAGAENRRISATGYVPGGKVVRVLEAGTYHIVLSNRDGQDPENEKTVNARFAAE